MDRLLLRQVCSLPVCYGSSIEGNNRNKQALVPTANRSQWILSLFPRHCRNGAVKNSRSVSAECLDPTRVLLPLTRLHPMAATSLFVPNYNRSSKRCASCARWFCLQNRLLRDQTDKTAFWHDCKAGFIICLSGLVPTIRCPARTIDNRDVLIRPMAIGEDRGEFCGYLWSTYGTIVANCDWPSNYWDPYRRVWEETCTGNAVWGAVLPFSSDIWQLGTMFKSTFGVLC